MIVQTEASNADALAKSFAFCQELTKARAKNFYYALRLLPRPKRSAMYALYAWMRLADDIADEEDGRSIQQRADDLDALQRQTHDALTLPTILSSHLPSELLFPAFSDIVRRYAIPHELFDDMIAGQRQDLHPVRLRNFDELHQYCYRVASVVGLASIQIWGYEGGESTRRLAIDRGIAFQLTNILRDLREDAIRGRVYLPEDELSAHGISTDDLAAGRETPGFVDLMRFQIDRAQSYFRSSADLDSRIERDSRTALLAMTGIYRGLLKKIARRPACVLHGRVRLSLFSKLLIALAARLSRSRRME